MILKESHSDAVADSLAKTKRGFRTVSSRCLRRCAAYYNHNSPCYPNQPGITQLLHVKTAYQIKAHLLDSYKENGAHTRRPRMFGRSRAPRVEPCSLTRGSLPKACRAELLLKASSLFERLQVSLSPSPSLPPS